MHDYFHLNVCRGTRSSIFVMDFPTYLFYAQIEVVVTLVVVNFLGFLVIARYPTVRLSRTSMEKLRAGLPDLPKPLRTNILLRKP